MQNGLSHIRKVLRAIKSETLDQVITDLQETSEFLSIQAQEQAQPTVRKALEDKAKDMTEILEVAAKIKVESLTKVR